MNYFVFDEIKCWSLLNILHWNFQLPQSTYVNELVLTPISPLIKLHAKNLWKCIFWASRRVTFFIFSQDYTQSWGCLPPIPFRIFVDVALFHSSPAQHLWWSSLCRKIGNGWKLLLTVVTLSFVLNVTRLLDPTQKGIALKARTFFQKIITL